MSRLFSPLAVGQAKLEHRVAMAPLTRFRADDDWSATDLLVEYYEQRACVPGTLIVSEATVIAHNAVGLRNVPGIWAPEHIKAWKKVTDAVHRKGCVIYCQLWHQGRAAQANVLKSEGYRLLSSSAVPIDSNSPTPEAMTEEEIQEAIRDYTSAASNAIAAGFDGVEVHGANGYLPDQFLQSTCNKRQDQWGGSIENRSRFHLEITKSIIGAIGSDKVGMRLSPYSDFNGMLMEKPESTFEYLTLELKKLGLAYLHLVEARIKGNDDSDCGGEENVGWMIKLWDNSSPVLLAGGFTPESAKEAVDTIHKGYEIVIVFGRYFVANPDLVYRVREGVPLVKYDRSVFYLPKDPKGYIDYPFSEEYQKTVSAAA